jgi:hypothetical protein
MIENKNYPVNKIHNNVVLKASYKNMPDNSFNFRLLNSCGLQAHIDELNNMLMDVPFYVIAVSETCLRPNFHFDSFVDIINDALSVLVVKYSKILICGDFNVNLL